MSRKRPNILWYCTDQQRWDTIAALGNPHIRTPHLDALCARGTAFERAYVQSPICTPSRASMLTGRYPATHHVHRNSNVSFPPGAVVDPRLVALGFWRGGTCRSGRSRSRHPLCAVGRALRRHDATSGAGPERVAMY